MNRKLNPAVLRSQGLVGGQSIASWMFAALILGLVGCAGGDPIPKLAPVKGKVTVNGKPAADLVVTFESQVAGGGRSGGVTNAVGEYELSFLGSATPNPKGAAIGTHIVRITSSSGGSGGSKGGVEEAGGSPSDLGPTDDAKKPSGIAIPEKYNAASELKADVKDGDNPAINFDLQIAP